jgi:hypothetical protein
MSVIKKHLKLLVAGVVGFVIVAVKMYFALMIKRLIAIGLIATILGLLHLGSPSDSTLASHPKHGKGQRQVAQGSEPKSNPAEKLAGPMAPVSSSGPALTPSAPLGAGAISAARNVAAATNQHMANETGQEVSPVKGAKPAPAPSQPAQAPNTPVVQQGAPKASPATAANSNPDAPVMRETFDYARDTRRDPFVSLMTTSDLRPTLTDLRLTGILYDLSGRRPVAILRDIAGGQWRVTTGMTLGRMRVAQIKPKTIIFTIEEFGFNRQDSLILGDTTRVRHR